MRRHHAAAFALAMIFSLGAHAAGTLRVGLNEDPDLADPARAGSYVGRIVFAAMCDKLVDIDAKLSIVPQLATSWAWAQDNMSLTLHLRPDVKFQDGEPMDAHAVQVNLDRYHTASHSLRKGELGALQSVEVVDPLTVVLHLSRPDAPLLAVLADRAGMMMSPKALAADGDHVADHPICAGPFKLTERVAQDHITLDRFPGYWNAKSIFLDRITYRPIPDTTVKLVNLGSGQLDLIERMAATDAPAVKKNPKLHLYEQPGVAYQAILFNLGHGPAAKSPLGEDVRVRQAFAKAIDRAAINQVVFDGTQTPSNQFEAPHTPHWDPAFPVPPRDLAGAKKLLQEAGLTKVPVTLLVANSPDSKQVGELIQTMAGEAGFDVKLRVEEANTGVAAAKVGDFQAFGVIWSGRADPDGNSSIWLSKNGFLNWGNYESAPYNDLLNQARAVTDVAQRRALYAKADAIFQQDTDDGAYHQTWMFASSTKVTGFVPVPDGLIRPQGIKLAP